MTNWKEVYQDRIEQIKKDIIKAVHNKNWSLAAKLRAEKSDLENKISKMEH